MIQQGFVNGSSIQATYAETTSDRARGSAKFPILSCRWPTIERTDITGELMKFTVKMKKTKLLTQLRANKKKHLTMLRKARKIWREQVMDAADGLEEMYNGLDCTEDDICKKIAVLTNLRCEVPTDMSATYDDSTAMVESHSGTTIELTQEDFMQLVQDQWHWKRAWNETVSSYMAAQ